MDGEAGDPTGIDKSTGVSCQSPSWDCQLVCASASQQDIISGHVQVPMLQNLQISNHSVSKVRFAQTHKLFSITYNKKYVDERLFYF